MNNEPKVNVFVINLNYVFFGLRCLGYLTAWVIFGEYTVPNAISFALGSTTVELLYQGYKYLTNGAKERDYEKNLDFFRLVDGRVMRCSMAEATEQLSSIAKRIKDRAIEHLAEPGPILDKPFYKHDRIGSISMTACWTGASIKDGPVEPWDVIIKLSTTGQEQRKSYSSWEQAEAEFDKFSGLFKKAQGLVEESTKTPTIH